MIASCEGVSYKLQYCFGQSCYITKNLFWSRDSGSGIEERVFCSRERELVVLIADERYDGRLTHFKAFLPSLTSLS